MTSAGEVLSTLAAWLLTFPHLTVVLASLLVWRVVSVARMRRHWLLEDAIIGLRDHISTAADDDTLPEEVALEVAVRRWVTQHDPDAELDGRTGCTLWQTPIRLHANTTVAAPVRSWLLVALHVPDAIRPALLAPTDGEVEVAVTDPSRPTTLLLHPFATGSPPDLPGLLTARLPAATADRMVSRPAGLRRTGVVPDGLAPAVRELALTLWRDADTTHGDLADAVETATALTTLDRPPTGDGRSWRAVVQR